MKTHCISSMTLWVALVALCMVIISTSDVRAGIVYVKGQATGLNNGSTWTHAFTDLQQGIDAANSGDQVWVAKGTYTPSSGYRMKNNVEIYGGFGGWEYPEIPDLLKKRDLVANKTVLDGLNNRRVFYHPDDMSPFINNTAVLDGFTIQRGNGGSEGGGGMYNGGIVDSGVCNSPTLVNCIFTANQSSYGNAIYNKYAAPVLIRCQIISNSYLAAQGGGIYNTYSQPVFIACWINHNIANYGGGMFSNSSTITMKNCLFNENSVTGSYNASAGGAMYNQQSIINLTNVTIASNTSVFYGPGLNNNGGSGTLLNCLAYSNTSTVYANVSVNGTAFTYEYSSIDASSPNVDAGDPNTTTEQAGETDYNGNPRFYGDNIDRGYLETSPDTDGDGLVDSLEISIGTSVNLTDTDSDGMPDKWEYENSLNPITDDAGDDFDNDGITNKEEYNLGTLPYLLDTDHDNMPDGWENDNSLDPLTDDRWGDLDGDGHSNYKEYLGNSSPNDATDLPDLITIYVNDDATGENSGLSWVDAFRDLQDAVDFVGAGDIILVAAGTYKPTKEVGGAGTRYLTFQMKKGVKIVGGLAGNEPLDYDLNLRDFSANKTVFSGEIGSASSLADNCLHVFAHYDGTDLDETAILDGVTITRGHANSSGHGAYGGGMYNVNVSPILKNCRFEDNTGTYGGGIANTGSSSPVLLNTMFLDNNANFGAGLFTSGSSSPRITNCNFINNTAEYGAGIYNGNGATSLVKNTILWGSSNEIFNIEASIDITWSNIQGGYPGKGNISIDPQFVAAGDFPYKIGAGSPCINAGDPATTNGEAGETDPSGQNRIICTIDIGMYENALPDRDCDGIYDMLEDINGNGNLDAGETDPDIADTDGDTMNDGWETKHGLNPRINDSGNDPDNDGLTNLEEYQAGTDPFAEDSDHDGMPDAYEIGNGLDPDFDDRWHDLDGDGSNNFREYIGGTLPDDETDLPEPLVFFVNIAATGDETGLSWDDAYTAFQDAVSISCNNDKVWVATGTYLPTQSMVGNGDRYKSFNIKNNVSVYGGFQGNEDPAIFNLKARDFTANETILSGDMSGNDNPGDTTTRDDNAYHVFYHPALPELDATAVLDGFTICKGNATGSASPFDRGGGMYNSTSSPTIVNCLFTNNSAKYGGAMGNFGAGSDIRHCEFSNNSAVFGGGIWNDGSDLLFSDCSFSGNIATDTGGGVYNNSSSQQFIKCMFEQNKSQRTSYTNAYDVGGGAIYSRNSSSVFELCRITENQAGVDGAGVNAYLGTLSFVNCLIAGNFGASRGGGIALQSVATTFTNCTITGNATQYAGGGIARNGTEALYFNNCILWNNTCTQHVVLNNFYCPIETRTNITAVYSNFNTEISNYFDPKFTDTANQNYSLMQDSSCKDTGNPSTTIGQVGSLDLDLQYRFQGSDIDMGAFEYCLANNAPTLTAVGDNSDFTEGGAGVVLYSGTSVSTVEFYNRVLQVELTVEQLSDGPSEILSIDGTDVSLTSGTGITIANGFDYSVSLAGGIATVIIETDDDFLTTRAETLIDNLAYKNNSDDPSAGDRMITLTRIQDNGGTMNGGTDTTALNLVSTVTVIPVNDAPFIKGLDGDAVAYAEGDGAVTIDRTPAAAMTDVDSDDFDGGTLTVLISAGKDSVEDRLSFHTGGSVALSGTTAGSTVSVGGTVIGTLSQAISEGYDLVVILNGDADSTSVTTLITAISYENTDTDDPTAGQRKIDVTLSDGDGETSETVSVTVTVAGVNDAPVANVDTATTPEDTPVAITVTDDDTDVDGTIDAGTVQITANPGHGQISVNPVTGIVIYTPNLNFYGSDLFTYTVKDNSGAISNAATVQLTVTDVNDAPVAHPDTATAPEDTPVMITVTGDDTDVDGTIDVTTVTITDEPRHGNASVDPVTGKVRYTPSQDYFGPDSFSYTVKDDDGAASNIATVQVTVTDVNDAPVAYADTVTTTEDTPVTIAVTGNDKDIDGTIDVTTVQITTDPEHGNVIVDSTTGMVTYTPAQDFFGNDTFARKVRDNDGDISNTAQVFVIVSPVNDPPGLETNTGLAVIEHTTGLITNADLKAADPDNVITDLIYILTSPASHGVLFLDVNGNNIADGEPELLTTGETFTQGNIDNGRLKYIHDGLNGASDSFTFDLSDQLETVEGLLFMLTITAVPAPPVAITNEASIITILGAALNGTVNAKNLGTTVSFEYGPTLSYGSMITADLSPVTGREDTQVSGTVSGLFSDTAYHYRIVVVNSEGMAVGEDKIFTTLKDTDNDGMSDEWEIAHNFDPTNPDDGEEDSDGDGLKNAEEYQNNTNPHNADSDEDGLSDQWELNNGFNPTVADENSDGIKDGQEDPDGDGLSNVQEALVGTRPDNGDTDNDGIKDGDEDNDGDKLTNLAEFAIGTDPNLKDTDGDSLSDNWELDYGFDPLLADSNGDGKNDGDEDPDGDGVANRYEEKVGTNPNLVDSDDNQINDGDEDPDADGITTLDEIALGLNPGVNELPEAVIAQNTQTVGEDIAVILDGSGSSDPDDGIASYLWEQIEGDAITMINADTAVATIVSPQVSEGGFAFKFRLTVTTTTRQTASATCIINVTWDNVPPVANAGPDSTVSGGESVLLDGSVSTDSDGTIVAYSWEQTGGTAVTLSDQVSVRPIFIAPETVSDETLTFKLTVTDQEGLQGSDICEITIQAVPEQSGSTGAGGGRDNWSPCFIESASGPISGFNVIISTILMFAGVSIIRKK